MESGKFSLKHTKSRVVWIISDENQIGGDGELQQEGGEYGKVPPSRPGGG